MTNPTPVIGTQGRYILSPPFDGYSANNEIYTCQGLRYLDDYLSLSEDPFSLIYEPVGITRADYADDLKNNALIVSLVKESGEILYLPEKYIQSYPILDGVIYQNRGLAINLGPLPTSTDLSGLLLLLQQDIYGAIGITPKVVEKMISAPIVVADADHQLAQNQRQLNLSRQLPLRAQCQKYQEENSYLLAKISELEAFIISTNPPP